MISTPLMKHRWAEQAVRLLMMGPSTWYCWKIDVDRYFSVGNPSSQMHDESCDDAIVSRGERSMHIAEITPS